MLRARELTSTGIPHDYQVDYEALVINPREVEQKAHKLLATFSEAKEWFRCSHVEAVQAIRACCETAPIHEGGMAAMSPPDAARSLPLQTAVRRARSALAHLNLVG